MGRRLPEVGFVGSGLNTESAHKGAFVLNMLSQGGSWRVRKGFGQMAEFDTWMLLPRTSNSVHNPYTDWGYLKQLGTQLIKTNFGHTQILSVWLAQSIVSEGVTKYTTGQFFAVRIYDVTANTSYEVVLTRHTSNVDRASTPLPFQHGTYATNRDDDFQDWIGGIDEDFFFVEYMDRVYFGSQHAGVWVYSPVDLPRNLDRLSMPLRLTSISSARNRQWAPGYEEDCSVVQLVASRGINHEGFAYLLPGELPAPVALGVIGGTTGGRLMLASGNQIWFSDPLFPASFMADNWIFIPAEDELVGVREVAGNIMAWTSAETWLYRPNYGETLLSGGHLTRLSKTVGLAGPSAVTRTDAGVVWVDANGIYLSAGQGDLTRISGEVDGFFSGFADNPLTDFFTHSGYSAVNVDQPAGQLNATSSRINVTYAPSIRGLIVTFPDRNFSLVQTEGKWSIWGYESRAFVSGGVATVGIARNISNPWILADTEDVYLVGGPHVQQINDSGIVLDVRSMYVLRYGRGGALDRSVGGVQLDLNMVAKEDYRQVVGAFGGAGVMSPPLFVFEEPIEVGAGYVLPNGSASPAGTMLFPVSLVLDSLTFNPDTLLLHFHFDPAAYTPLFVGGGGDADKQVDLVFPPRRHASQAGYGLAVPTVSRRRHCYDNAGVVLDAGGDYIKIDFNGGIGGWSASPHLNIVPMGLRGLFLIPFRRIGTATASGPPSSAPATSISRAAIPAYTASPGVLTWYSGHMVDDAHTEDADVALAPEWCYLSEELSLNDGMTAMLRDVYGHVVTHGEGSQALVSPWLYGLLNVAFSSDWEGWGAQLITLAGQGSSAISDVARLREIRSVAPITTKILDASGTVDVLKHKTFDNGLKWGSTASQAANDAIAAKVITDSEELAPFSASSIVRGENFRVMLFGFMNNRDAHLVLDSKAKAALRFEPGRRRVYNEVMP